MKLQQLLADVPLIHVSTCVYDPSLWEYVCTPEQDGGLRVALSIIPYRTVCFSYRVLAVIITFIIFLLRQSANRITLSCDRLPGRR